MCAFIRVGGIPKDAILRAPSGISMRSDGLKWNYAMETPVPNVIKLRLRCGAPASYEWLYLGSLSRYRIPEFIVYKNSKLDCRSIAERPLMAILNPTYTLTRSCVPYWSNIIYGMVIAIMAISLPSIARSVSITTLSPRLVRPPSQATESILGSLNLPIFKVDLLFGCPASLRFPR